MVTTAYQPQGEELRTLIHEVVEEVRQREDVAAIATEMETMAGTKEDPIAIPTGVGFPALVEHMRRGKRPPGEPWKSNRYYKVNDTIVHEGQRPGSQYNAQVSLGKTSQYPKVSSLTLTQIMEDAGMTDAQLAVAIRDHIRGKPLPVQLHKHAKKLDRLKFLLFGREAIRNTGLVAFTPMTLSLIASNQDEMTWHEAFASYETDSSRHGKRGAFPMSMENAQLAAAELEQERQIITEPQLTGETPPERRRSEPAQELAKREIELATRWITLLLKAERLQVFHNREHAKAVIIEKIVEFYRGCQRARKS